MLVEGPVEVIQPDGEVVGSDRPLVALCTCRRSDRLPFCDTSHRRRLPRSDAPGPGPQAPSGLSSDD